jgi:hypothetical protein
MLVEQVNILLHMARGLPNARIQRRTPPMLESLAWGWTSSVSRARKKIKLTISVGGFCVQFLQWFAGGGPVLSCTLDV